MPTGDTTVDWAAEHRAARARITELVSSLSESELATIVAPCPAWTVHDVVSHVVAMPVALAAGDYPAGEVQAWIDGLVDARRGRAVADVLAEWHASATEIDALLERFGDGAGRLVFDVVTHEHDIRLAAGRPGERDSSGVWAAIAAIPGLLAPDLERMDLPAVRLTSAGRTSVVGAGDPELAVELEPFELIRVFASRRSERQLRALPWQGDLDRYLPALTHLPLPLADIIE
jgi:uncharacterized protein (TIGR03083 family)